MQLTIGKIKWAGVFTTDRLKIFNHRVCSSLMEIGRRQAYFFGLGLLGLNQSQRGNPSQACYVLTENYFQLPKRAIFHFSFFIKDMWH